MIDLSKLGDAKGLKICHLNICSIVNKVDQFRMHFENSGIDVITVSKTWLSKDITSDILQMNGFQLYSWDRLVLNHKGSTTKKGGGL